MQISHKFYGAGAGAVISKKFGAGAGAGCGLTLGNILPQKRGLFNIIEDRKLKNSGLLITSEALSQNLK